MEPTFFGDKQRPMYGVYQSPLSSCSGDTAVLLCYPFFQEYIRSHRAFCYLSQQLAKVGCHVFRFDYSCTGDSFGILEDAGYERWKMNVSDAADELRDLSGVKKISLVGLRMGAMLAAATEINNVKDLVMWDPVISGADYLSSLSLLHQNMLLDSDRFPYPRKDVKTENFKELIGFSIPDDLYKSLERTDLLNENFSSFDNIHIVTSGQYINTKELRDKILAANVNVTQHTIAEDKGGWNELASLEETLMPYETMKTISGLFS